MVGGLLVAGAALSSRTVPAAPSAVDAAPPTFVHAYVPGRTLTYSLELRSEALLDGQLDHAETGEVPLHARRQLGVSSVFTGALMLLPVLRRPDGSARVLASLSLDDIQVSLSGRAAGVPRATFDPLARGFLVDYSASGAVLGIALEEATHPIAARLASQIIGFLQLVAPPDHAIAWEGDERDSLGEVHARYSVLSDPPSRPGDTLIQKLVQRTSAPEAGGAFGRLIATGRGSAAGNLAYEVDVAQGLLVEAAGALTTEQLLGDLRVGASDSTLLVRLTGKTEGSAEAAGARLAERLPHLGPPRALDPAALRAAEQRRLHEALLASIDLPAIVTDARAHPPPPASQEAATYDQILVAAVEASPESRLYLEKVLLDAKTGEDAFLPIARAFGEVGSPEAQQSLGRVVASRPPRDPAREAAMFSLSRVDAPTDATIALLEASANAAAEPWSHASLLYLGRAAGQLDATFPARGRPVLQRLVQRVHNAPDDVARTRALEALGNAGSPWLTDELAFWRRAEAPGVRRAAVSAYRFIPTAAARDVMLEAIQHDADASVRAAAIDAVLLRTPDDAIADTIAGSIERDADESIRKTSVSKLISLCRRNKPACRHLERLKKSGDEWTRHELSTFTPPR